MQNNNIRITNQEIQLKATKKILQNVAPLYLI